MPTTPTTVPGSVASARHAIGAAKGAALDASGGSSCAVCGVSPFGFGRSTKSVTGPLFVDYDLLFDPSLPDVCEGCALMLGGRPSKEDPPVRMGHFAVLDGVIERPDGARLVELLLDPPSGLSVIGWTKSRQRHASLRAGLCTPDLLRVGTESSAVEWVASEHAQLIRAVADLRVKATRDAVLSGAYPSHVVVALGDSWARNEAVVAQHRPSTRLDLVVAITRRSEAALEAQPLPISEPIRLAAELVLDVSDTSNYRRDDPIRYWGTLLPRRLAAAASRATLTHALARLMEDVQPFPTAEATVRAVDTVAGLDDEQSASVLVEWRTRPAMVLAVMKIIREERKR